MNQFEPIEFVLDSKANGAAITPRTIGLSHFNEFNQQVETFIGLGHGSGRSPHPPTPSPRGEGGNANEKAGPAPLLLGAVS